MTSLTVENYLKAILQISLQHEAAGVSAGVSTGELASKLHVSPGTVTSMLKTLAESGLANYKPYEGVSLTEAGRRLSLRMLRRHRLIELFLVHTLNLTWDQVHEEAEHMEHAVSDFLIDRIDDYLGRPESDPHGDPIPTAEGEMRGDAGNAVPLSTCRPGATVRLARVTNQRPEFLRYLSETGLELGAVGVVQVNNAEAGLVTVDFGGRAISLGTAAAESLLVDSVGG
jgi:DtxR family Mn-dependent transcriptional regulator